MSPFSLVFLATVLVSAQEDAPAVSAHDKIHDLVEISMQQLRENQVALAQATMQSAIEIFETLDSTLRDKYTGASEIAAGLQHLGYSKRAVDFYSIACLWSALTKTADLVENCHNAGWLCQHNTGEKGRGINFYKHALRIQPNSETAYSLAQVMSESFFYKGALSNYRRAVKMAPKDHQKISSVAMSLWNFNRFATAYRVLKHSHSLSLASVGPSVGTNMYYLQHQFLSATRACLWEAAESTAKDMHEIMWDLILRAQLHGRNYKDIILPHLPEMYVPGDLQLALASAKSLEFEHEALLWAGQVQRIFPETEWVPEAQKRLKIGYVYAQGFSDVFPVPRLVQGIFSYHRKNSEVYCFSMEPRSWENSASSIEADCEHFEILQTKIDQNVGEYIASKGIQILYDISGHTLLARPSVFFFRPAPIIINLLAYPGTMGCASINHIATDSLTIPPEYSIYYSESVIIMPHTSFVNSFRNTPRQISLLQAESELAFEFSCHDDEFLPCGSVNFCEKTKKIYVDATLSDRQGRLEEAELLYELSILTCKSGHQAAAAAKSEERPHARIPNLRWRSDSPAVDVSKNISGNFKIILDTKIGSNENNTILKSSDEIITPDAEIYLNLFLDRLKKNSKNFDVASLEEKIRLLTKNLTLENSTDIFPAAEISNLAAANFTSNLNFNGSEIPMKNSTEVSSEESSSDEISDMSAEEIEELMAKGADTATSWRNKFSLKIDDWGYFPPGALGLAAKGVQKRVGNPNSNSTEGHPVVGEKIHDDLLASFLTSYPSRRPSNVEGIFGLSQNSLENLREKYGIPKDVFVFAAFCAPYKYKRETWQTWMNILQRVPNSVLWLLDYIYSATQTLKNETKIYHENGYLFGAGTKRVIFTKLLPRDFEMLLKGNVVDLALDTPHFNGHTTAVETLWAGVPLLTLPLSDRMHGRLSASMIASASRPMGDGATPHRGITSKYLISRNLIDYEDLAVALACGQRAPGRGLGMCVSAAGALGVLEFLREAVVQGRLNGGLNNVKMWTSDSERANKILWDIRQQTVGEDDTTDIDSAEPSGPVTHGITPTYKLFHVILNPLIEY